MPTEATKERAAMRIAELKKELQDVLTAQRKRADELANTDHPQSAEVRKAAESMAEIVSAILARIDGDRIALNFYR